MRSSIDRPDAALVSARRSSACNIAALLARTARCWPDRIALAAGTTPRHDYRTFAARVSRLAGALLGSGLEPGDRVVLIARNVPEYLEVLFGAWWAGAVAVPVNGKLHPKEVAFVLRDSGAKWIFADESWAAALGEGVLPGAGERVVRFASPEYERLLASRALPSPAACDRDDGAWLFYTSGTTGRPKGVVITHANLLAMSVCYLSNVVAVAPGAALLHPAPLSHGSGLYAVPHVLAGAVNVVPESGGFDPDEIASLLRAWSGCSFFAAPTMAKRLVASGALGEAHLPHLDAIVLGGGPMYVADCEEAFAALGPRLAQIYGQGESPMTITAMSRALLTAAVARNDLARLASVGVAHPGIEVRVADPAGDELPVGAVGEVLVRGPTVMRGYWNNEAATAATLAGGWLHTGDLGSFDDDGFLTLKDRSKDLIISGGANIYPREVEEVLLGHDAVVEAAVVGRPHEEWGEEVVAFVVARAGVDRGHLERDLDRRCLDHIARFKRPRHYAFVDELPKNDTGKVLKTALRARLGTSGC